MPETTRRPRGLGPRIELVLERGLFAARWLMTPVYVVMVLLLFLIMVKIAQQFLAAVPKLLTLDVSKL
ncbi:MAG: hypothetical protein JO143_05705, partial [Acetobacteraceae bacterium]|nr:hypothetical protein [Acetobacteraceae bacterium]